MPSGPKWTPEQDDDLISGHDEGLSVSQIANRINDKHGTQYSRNAVIGRCNRLGLVAKNRPHVQQPARKRCPSASRIIVFKPRPAPPVVEFIDPAALVAFADLGPVVPNAVHCRWPVGDLYCGTKPLEGQSYCAGHCAVAYVPPEQRRRAGWRR